MRHNVTKQKVNSILQLPWCHEVMSVGQETTRIGLLLNQGNPEQSLYCEHTIPYTTHKSGALVYNALSRLLLTTRIGTTITGLRIRLKISLQSTIDR